MLTRWRRWLCVAVTLAPLVPLSSAAQEVSRERLWSIPQEGIGRPDVTGSIGRFEKDASGSYNIYGKNGDRVGVGKREPMGPLISTTCEANAGSKSAPAGSNRAHAS